MTQIVPDTTDIPPEPPDRTGFYWPETTTDTPSILILRDDTATATTVPHLPDAHWHCPNSVECPWQTWPQALEMLAELGLDLADATRFTVGGAS